MAIIIGGAIAAIAADIASFGQMGMSGLNNPLAPNVAPTPPMEAGMEEEQKMQEMNQPTGKQDLTMSSMPVNFNNVRITEVTDTTAVVEGTTNIPVECEVEYGTNGSFTSSASDSMMMDMGHEEHMVKITGLTPDTTYNYRFKATVDGETLYSDMKTFTTMP